MSLVPLKLEPEFRQILMKFQAQIMLEQKKKLSLPKIATMIIKMPSFANIEKELLASGKLKKEYELRWD